MDLSLQDPSELWRKWIHSVAERREHIVRAAHENTAQQCLLRFHIPVYFPVTHFQDHSQPRIFKRPPLILLAATSMTSFLP